MKPALTEQEKQDKINRVEKEIVDIITKDIDVSNVCEIFCKYSGISKATFYHYGLDKSDIIKNTLEKNKTAIKKEMQQNWRKSDAAPALQMGALKLMGTDRERKCLSQTYIEHTGKDQGPIEVRDMSEADINKRLEELDSEE